MKKLISICASLTLILAIMSPVEGSELDISGFFDVHSTYQKSADDKNEFGLGQAEINFDNQLSEKAAIAVAVTYNNETSAFEVGEAEIAINLFNDERRFVQSINVAAGQFYVPFGIDYHVYRSIDRKLVTSPWAVGLTHGGWNDYGVKLSASSQYGNFMAYGVNGFESSMEVINDAQSLATGLALGEEVNTTPANAFGGRLGVIPVPEIEFGGSIAVGFNESGKDEMMLMGGDLRCTVQNLEVKGEYIVHSLNRSIVEEQNKGYYFQSTYNFPRAFLVGRYGSFQPDGADWTAQYSLGVGYKVVDDVELRFETFIDDNNSDNNANILQLVAGF